MANLRTKKDLKVLNKHIQDDSKSSEIRRLCLWIRDNTQTNIMGFSESSGLNDYVNQAVSRNTVMRRKTLEKIKEKYPNFDVDYILDDDEFTLDEGKTPIYDIDYLDCENHKEYNKNNKGYITIPGLKSNLAITNDFDSMLKDYKYGTWLLLTLIKEKETIKPNKDYIFIEETNKHLARLSAINEKEYIIKPTTEGFEQYTLEKTNVLKIYKVDMSIQKPKL